MTKLVRVSNEFSIALDEFIKNTKLQTGIELSRPKATKIFAKMLEIKLRPEDFKLKYKNNKKESARISFDLRY